MPTIPIVDHEVVRTWFQQGGLSSKALAQKAGMSQATARRHIRDLRDALVIVSYDEPEGRGKPSPVYGWKTSPDQKDALPNIKRLKTGAARQKKADQKKINALRKARDEALAKVTTDEEREEIQKEFLRGCQLIGAKARKARAKLNEYWREYRKNKYQRKRSAQVATTLHSAFFGMVGAGAANDSDAQAVA